LANTDTGSQTRVSGFHFHPTTHSIVTVTLVASILLINNKQKTAKDINKQQPKKKNLTILSSMIIMTYVG
jgi:hypothetical protein